MLFLVKFRSPFFSPFFTDLNPPPRELIPEAAEVSLRRKLALLLPSYWPVAK